jgi:hypothetical protein
MYNFLRKLAKKTEMLNLFTAAKDMGGFELFKNKNDLSNSQNYFLSYLYFYYSLNNDIASKKVSEKVLTDEIYENAYSYYRNNEKETKDNGKLNTKRTIQGVFSKDNKLNLPTEEK